MKTESRLILLPYLQAILKIYPPNVARITGPGTNPKSPYHSILSFFLIVSSHVDNSVGVTDENEYWVNQRLSRQEMPILVSSIQFSYCHCKIFLLGNGNIFFTLSPKVIFAILYLFSMSFSLKKIWKCNWQRGKIINNRIYHCRQNWS